MEYTDYVLENGDFNQEKWKYDRDILKFEARYDTNKRKKIRFLDAIRKRYKKKNKPQAYKRYVNDNDKIFRRIFNSAWSRDIPFFIEFDEFEELICKPCHYCGGITTGLDRVDSNKRYEIENVVPCCRQCNMMKYTYTTEEFIVHACKICNHMK